MAIAKSPAPLNLPCPFEAVTVPETGVPALNKLTPFTTTDCASVPVKESPTLLSLALTVCPRRTTTEVPAGTVYSTGFGGGGGAGAAAGTEAGAGGGALAADAAGGGAGAAAGSLVGAG